MLERSSARYVILVYLGDMAQTIVALLLARWLRVLLPLGKTLNPEGIALYWPMFVLVVLVWTVTLSAFRVYDPHRFVQTRNALGTALLAIGVATLVLAGVLYFSYRGLSRLLYVYFFILDVVLCLALRIVLRRLVGRNGAAHELKVLILGAGPSAQRIAASLDDAQWLGVHVRGMLDDDRSLHGQEIAGHTVIGSLNDAPGIILRDAIREVILALPMDSHARLSELVATLQALPVNIKVVPDYSDLAFYRNSLEQIGDTLVIGLKEPVVGPIDRAIKRCFDVTVSMAGLIVLLPLYVVLGIMIKLSSPGPILYRSRRIGERGVPFDMLKFRTMVRDADKTEGDLVSTDAEGRIQFDKREDDPRITPLGHWLRRTSLDELPQLVNVLKGEMSMVGPRPELPALVERYEPWQRKRLSVPQGITGWWQIAGRHKAKHLHIEDDLYYIRNYSLLLDVRILARTLGAIIRGDGAY